ncbi:zinc finger (ccch type) motif-containing protein [Cystoisospora suis]|uniref:Zinc finger (Ccch type) motif-containing protein n=1 Tax=Cystoisospora suis TaxID=483139 RepID=A0A2C6L7D1_9APIC|nr:zinc finger (ccch type) motif-containing protein [Cystoisospora suis]
MASTSPDILLYEGAAACSGWQSVSSVDPTSSAFGSPGRESSSPALSRAIQAAAATRREAGQVVRTEEPSSGLSKISSTSTAESDTPSAGMQNAKWPPSNPSISVCAQTQFDESFFSPATRWASPLQGSVSTLTTSSTLPPPATWPAGVSNSPGWRSQTAQASTAGQNHGGTGSSRSGSRRASNESTSEFRWQLPIAASPSRFESGGILREDGDSLCVSKSGTPPMTYDGSVKHTSGELSNAQVTYPRSIGGEIPEPPPPPPPPQLRQAGVHASGQQHGLGCLPGREQDTSRGPLWHAGPQAKLEKSDAPPPDSSRCGEPGGERCVEIHAQESESSGMREGGCCGTPSTGTSGTGSSLTSALVPASTGKVIELPTKGGNSLHELLNLVDGSRLPETSVFQEPVKLAGDREAPGIPMHDPPSPGTVVSCLPDYCVTTSRPIQQENHRSRSVGAPGALQGPSFSSRAPIPPTDFSGSRRSFAPPGGVQGECFDKAAAFGAVPLVSDVRKEPPSGPYPAYPSPSSLVEPAAVDSTSPDRESENCAAPWEVPGFPKSGVWNPAEVNWNLPKAKGTVPKTTSAAISSVFERTVWVAFEERVTAAATGADPSTASARVNGAVTSGTEPGSVTRGLGVAEDSMTTRPTGVGATAGSGVGGDVGVILGQGPCIIQRLDGSLLRTKGIAPQDPNKRAVRRMMFSKTKICPWFEQGKCLRGDLCNYAHSRDELRVLPVTKRLCPSYMKMGRCSNPHCSFAHSIEEVEDSKRRKQGGHWHWRHLGGADDVWSNYPVPIAAESRSPAFPVQLVTAAARTEGGRATTAASGHNTSPARSALLAVGASSTAAAAPGCLQEPHGIQSLTGLKRDVRELLVMGVGISPSGTREACDPAGTSGHGHAVMATELSGGSQGNEASCSDGGNPRSVPPSSLGEQLAPRQVYPEIEKLILKMQQPEQHHNGEEDLGRGRLGSGPDEKQGAQVVDGTPVPWLCSGSSDTFEALLHTITRLQACENISSGGVSEEDLLGGSGQQQHGVWERAVETSPPRGDGAVTSGLESRQIKDLLMGPHGELTGVDSEVTSSSLRLLESNGGSECVPVCDGVRYASGLHQERGGPGVGGTSIWTYRGTQHTGNNGVGSGEECNWGKALAR